MIVLSGFWRGLRLPLFLLILPRFTFTTYQDFKKVSCHESSLEEVPDAPLFRVADQGVDGSGNHLEIINLHFFIIKSKLINILNRLSGNDKTAYIVFIDNLEITALLDFI